MTRLLALAVLAIGCAPAPPPVATDPQPAPADAGPTAVPDAQPANDRPRADAPFRRVRRELGPAPGETQLHLVARGAIAARIAPDQNTTIVVRGTGGHIIVPGRRNIRLPRWHIVSSAFSPDSKHVAITDERQRLAIVSIAKGRVIAKLQGGVEPRWLSNTRLGYRRGCTAMVFDLHKPLREIGSITRPCFDVVHKSRDFRTWWVASRGRYRRGVIQTYKELRALHMTGPGQRTEKSILRGDDEAHFMMPRVSPAGDRACFADAEFDLHCWHDGNVERIARNVRRPIAFSETGRKLLFAVGSPRNRTAKIVVADFRDRTLTEVPRAGREWFSFLPGGTRIVGHGGSANAIVYDLAAGWQADIGSPRFEWEGLWTVPGDPDRVLLGRERGGTRDIYEANLP